MMVTDPSTQSTFEQRMTLENVRNRDNRCLVHGGPVALTEMIAYRLIYRGSLTYPPNVSTTVPVCATCWDKGKEDNQAWADAHDVTIHAIDGRELYA